MPGKRIAATPRKWRERCEEDDSLVRKSSPLDLPVRKPKATWVEPLVNAEIEYSGITGDGLLRAAVFKGCAMTSNRRGADRRRRSLIRPPPRALMPEFRLRLGKNESVASRHPAVRTARLELPDNAATRVFAAPC